MPELPIVAEVYNWPSYILGAILLVIAIAMAWFAWQRLKGHKRVAGFVSVLIPLVLGLILIGRDIGWQLRIDQNGIALRAPFEPLWPSGEIAWSNVTAVEIVTHGNRSPLYGLNIRGQRGVELIIHDAGQLPPQFIALLQTVVAGFAPHVTDIKELDQQFQYAREHSTSLIYFYSVRDGRGVLLR